MIIQSRRNFIIGLTSALAAPAIVRAGSLMPVRAIKNFTLTDYNDLTLQTTVDILYSRFYIRPEWMTIVKEDGTVITYDHT